MVRSSKGIRAKTRNILKKKPRNRGMPPVTKSLQSFNIGDKVNLIIEPAIHKGQPHRRFHGLTGTVTNTRGRAYVLEVKQGKKYKTLVVRPEHLKRSEA